VIMFCKGNEDYDYHNKSARRRPFLTRGKVGGAGKGGGENTLQSEGIHGSGEAKSMQTKSIEGYLNRERKKTIGNTKESGAYNASRGGVGIMRLAVLGCGAVKGV